MVSRALITEVHRLGSQLQSAFTLVSSLHPPTHTRTAILVERAVIEEMFPRQGCLADVVDDLLVFCAVFLFLLVLLAFGYLRRR